MEDIIVELLNFNIISSLESPYDNNEEIPNLPDIYDPKKENTSELPSEDHCNGNATPEMTVKKGEYRAPAENELACMPNIDDIVDFDHAIKLFKLAYRYFNFSKVDLLDKNRITIY